MQTDTTRPHGARVLFDTDLLLHALLDEHVTPYDVLRAMLFARQGRVQAYVCASSLPMIYEELARANRPAAARQRLRELLTWVRVAAVDGQVLAAALAMEGLPFETALTLATATVAGLDLVVAVEPEEVHAPAVPVMAVDRLHAPAVPVMSLHRFLSVVSGGFWA